ncbi:CehA/McbA family metallohydrolase [Streptomyces actinomycinicus]|uniref:CehA/McbA family metallohydrolase n=1 Tax=Streptomyces actinomycinicus TaxID=1695166 RepID=A0A937EG24_9ACTN|nr:CehA/McbA family metallohydrolase [Streptomyces actinomycinicus]MBL1082368.1 CehA/McbA family metallohydrolase [Streptomyces actinomycinicus]
MLRLGTLLATGGLAAMVPAGIAGAATRSDGNQVTKTYRGHSSPGFDQWAYIDFDVPPGVNRISVTSSFEPFVLVPGVMSNVLDIGIFGPSGFRGWSGGARRDFTLSAADATPGYVPGPIGAGKWSVALGPIVYKASGMDWQVGVTLDYGPPLQPVPYDTLPDSIRGRADDWYRGDLHLHSVHSDGARTVDRMVADARESQLDFIATSDHNTSSTGVSWHGNVPTDLLVINAEEVTTRHGHWLAVGLPQGEWVDWRYAPGDPGALDGHVQRVHSLGGLVVAAHPMTPGPGSFWEFGLDHVDAMEVWNGPWTLDDAANVAVWHAALSLGKRIPGLGNSDAHATTDTIGLPHNVVHASALSATAILAALRQGRSYAAESAAVTVDLTASGAGRTAGPGEELPLGLFDPVDVTASVSGAPDTVVTLYTEWGTMASTAVGAGGSGRLHWRGWGKASLFARAEVRRLRPGSSTLDQMVALTNPVWFYGADRPPYAVERRVLFQSTRRADGTWTSMRPLPGTDVDPTFAGVQVSAAGMPDGTVQILGLKPDNSLWTATLNGSALSRPWQRLDGPGRQQDFTAREAAVTALPDGTSQLLATGMDGTLYHQQRRTDGTLTGFRSVPGFTPNSTWGATKISLAGMPDGSAHVLAYHTDGAMYACMRRKDGSWTAWTRPAGFGGAPTFAGPALAVAGLPDGSSQVVAVGLDGCVYHQVRRPDGRWDGFAPLAGVDSSRMGASSTDIAGMPDGSAQVVVVGRDGNVWHNIRKDDFSWTGFARIAGPSGIDPFPAGQVRITALADGTARVLGISAA